MVESSGVLFAYYKATRKVIRNEILLKSKKPISSFGEDPSGELYLVDYSGKVLKLVGN